MNSEIKTRLINTFGTISYLIVIFFFFTLILFMHNDVEDALKESWVASIYFLSVLATLGAAYIASSLFNDWKDIEKFKRHAEISEKIYYTILSIHKNLSELLVISRNNEIYTKKQRVAKIIREELHFSVTYIALDHMKSLKDNQNIKKSYEILKKQRIRHREYEKALKQDSKLQPTNFNNSDELLKINLEELNKTLDQMVTDNLK